jgi:hypothetical protein
MPTYIGLRHAAGSAQRHGLGAGRITGKHQKLAMMQESIPADEALPSAYV